MWFSKAAEPFLSTSVTLGSPSDSTTPRCQMVARGRFFAFYQTLNLLHWVRPDPSRRHRFIRSRESRNTVTTGPVGRGGLAGARKRLQCQLHFSDSTRSSGSPETGPSPPGTFVGTWLHKTGRLIKCRSSRPARTARQYPMLNALYISNSTGLNAFSVGFHILLILPRRVSSVISDCFFSL